MRIDAAVYLVYDIPPKND